MTEDDDERLKVDVEPSAPKSSDLEGRDTSMDPEHMTREDRVETGESRPILPDETVDGLDDTDEDIRRQGEGLTDEPPGRL